MSMSDLKGCQAPSHTSHPISLSHLLSHPEAQQLADLWCQALYQASPERLWCSQQQGGGGELLGVERAHALGFQGYGESEALALPLSLDELNLKGGGKMFGLLRCVDKEGRRYLLRAFSGQLQGAWHRAGWCPPLFNAAHVGLASWETQTYLHLLNRKIQERQGDVAELKRARRERSRELTKILREAYELRRLSVEGELERRSLAEHWPDAPLGVGDCCAPKLLCWAATLKLTPVALVELWWGAPQGSFHAGQTYAPCAERCLPLLGWLLGGS